MAKPTTKKGAGKKAAAAKPRAGSKKSDKAAPVADQAKGSNSAPLDPKARELFLRDLEEYTKLRAAMTKAQTNLRKFGKIVKQDGFTMRQIKLAFDIQTPEGEAVYRSLIANDLLAARYIGAEIGTQFDLFVKPGDVDPGDRAFHEGQKASMENRAAVPDYAPGTNEYDRYMAGFHEHQSSLVKNGISKLEKKDGGGDGGSGNGKGGAAKDAAPPRERRATAEKDAAPARDAAPSRPASGVGITRADYERQQSAAPEPETSPRAEAESHFQRKGTTVGTA